jgi:hypothetical protein
VTVVVEARETELDGAAVYIDFESTVLQVHELTKGEAFATVLQKKFDNDAGRIDFAAGTFSDHPSGTFTLLTIEFEAIAPTSVTELAFQFSPPRQTDATSSGTSVLTDHTNGQVGVHVANSTSETIEPGVPVVIEHDELQLAVGMDAVDEDMTITIGSLDEDLLPPLDPGMTNVTKGSRKGYRFLPHHSKFNSNLQVVLPYDPELLPDGFAETDIKTYYFDEELGSWQALEMDDVLTETEKMASFTDHFTDMINAVVTVPDAPESNSFNPTQIKDIKAADPGAGFNLMAPPQANNMGSATLSYPLEVPPGRVGIQPQLSVQYNSGGGNGWMGLGWDLPVQAITIDTRWGVPRYSGSQETETYLMGGQQLSPVAHRDALQPRTNEKVFHTRV